MKAPMEGKVALVTGAGSGIGRATAVAFARQGAKVTVADIDFDGGENTARQIKEEGGEALFVFTDVSDANDVRQMVERTIETFGRLDYAVNNAGIEGVMAPTADYTEEDWDRVMAVNLKGVWLGMKEEIPRVLEQGGGAIVNVASIAGLVGFANTPAYSASKGGVIQLSKVAALEYAGKIRVNVVCPGVIRTPMLERGLREAPEQEEQLTAAEPIGRLGTAEEVAAAIVWLCSDEASFVTGHPMVVDGGFVAR